MGGIIANFLFSGCLLRWFYSLIMVIIFILISELCVFEQEKLAVPCFALSVDG